MGGRVTLIIREANGDIEAYGSSTNILPLCLSDPRLFGTRRREIDAWKERFIAPLETMRDDYSRNHVTGRYEHPASFVYGESPGAAPTEYGLVAIDLGSRTIVSMQDYCYEPDAISLYSLTPNAALEPAAKGVVEADSTVEREANIVKLIDSGIARRMALPQPGDGFSSYTFKSPDITGQQALAKLKRLVSVQPSDKAGYILIEPANWTFARMQTTREGLEAAFNALAKLGIHPTQEEREQWREFARTRFRVTDGNLAYLSGTAGIGGDKSRTPRAAPATAPNRSEPDIQP